MAKALAFTDPFLPVPAAAIDADPAAAMRELYFRVARLEQSLQEQRVLASAEMAEVLLSQIAIADELTHVVESIGVPTNAQHAMLARGVAALGRRIMEDLGRRGVAPIETLGKPLDPDHSDAVGHEPGAGVAEGTVLREVRAGFVWRDIVLRRAQVVVCGRPPEPEQDPAQGANARRGGAR